MFNQQLNHETRTTHAEIKHLIELHILFCWGKRRIRRSRSELNIFVCSFIFSCYDVFGIMLNYTPS